MFAKDYLKINKTMDFYMNGTHWGLDPVTIKP